MAAIASRIARGIIGHASRMARNCGSSVGYVGFFGAFSEMCTFSEGFCDGAPGSNPVAPIQRDRKPFGEHVKGLSCFVAKVYAIEFEVQKHDFQYLTLGGEVGCKPLLDRRLREFKNLYTDRRQVSRATSSGSWQAAGALTAVAGRDTGTSAPITDRACGK